MLRILGTVGLFVSMFILSTQSLTKISSSKCNFFELLALLLFLLPHGFIQSVSWKFNAKAQMKFKGNVPMLAETALTVNAAYVGSIGNDHDFSSASAVQID